MTTKITVAGLNSITLGGGVATSTKPAWSRPSDWLTIPTVISSEQKFVGLHAVWPGDDNFCAVNCTAAYTVDWGDGTVENFATGVSAYHKYDYNNSALNGTLSSRGYKQAIVIITPQAGQNLTSLNLVIQHNQSGLNTGYSTGWLDINVSMPNCTNISIGSVNALGSVIGNGLLERLNLVNLNNKLFSVGGCFALQSLTFPDIEYTGSGAYMFYNCQSLQSLAPLKSGAMSNGYLMFAGCQSLQSLTVNTYNMTNMDTTFGNCRSLREIKGLDTRSATTLTNLFLNCVSLRTIPSINTSAVTIMSGMFNGCSALEYIPAINTNLVTTMSSMFANCNSLQILPDMTTGNVVSMDRMFTGCVSLKTIPNINTAAVSNASNMFAGCSALRTIPALTTNSVTNAAAMFATCTILSYIPTMNTSSVTNANQMFNSCVSLQSSPATSFTAVPSSALFNNVFNACRSLSNVSTVGIKNTFSVASCRLSNTALDTLFTNLPTVTGQTITITGNYGASTANTAIATGKGWTVTN